MKAVKQIIRGCGTLPGVGAHPGTGMFLFFIGLGAVEGSRNGLAGVVMGAGFMFVFIGAIYFWGAYERAKISDRMTRP